jgi:hypothetical protein
MMWKLLGAIVWRVWSLRYDRGEAQLLAAAIARAEARRPRSRCA